MYLFFKERCIFLFMIVLIYLVQNQDLCLCPNVCTILEPLFSSKKERGITTTINNRKKKSKVHCWLVNYQQKKKDHQLHIICTMLRTFNLNICVALYIVVHFMHYFARDFFSINVHWKKNFNEYNFSIVVPFFFLIFLNAQMYQPE